MLTPENRPAGMAQSQRPNSTQPTPAISSQTTMVDWPDVSLAMYLARNEGLLHKLTLGKRSEGLSPQVSPRVLNVGHCDRRRAEAKSDERGALLRCVAAHTSP